MFILPILWYCGWQHTAAWMCALNFLQTTLGLSSQSDIKRFRICLEFKFKSLWLCWRTANCLGNQETKFVWKCVPETCTTVCHQGVWKSCIRCWEYISKHVNMAVNSVLFFKLFPSHLANTMKCSSSPAGVTVLYCYASPTMLNKWTFSFKKHTITLFPLNTSRRLCWLCAPLT